METGEKQFIHGIFLSELEEWIVAAGEKKFRAKQIWQWLYHHEVQGWGEMKNIPQALRDRLEAAFVFQALEKVEVQESSTGTRKILSRLVDGELIEEVLIPAPDRRTVCVSSQVGCMFGCAFCASGQLGVKRNLKAGEIVGEALAAQREYGDRITNLVFMGIGEPFDNYDEVMRAVRILNDPDGFCLGARRITISTCGVVPGIQRLENEGLQVELSVSLHAPSETVRDSLMPVNQSWPLEELMEVCRLYTRNTKRIITFEYTMIRDVNDSQEDCRELIGLLTKFPCRVNLIPLSEIEEYEGKTSARETVEYFIKQLERAGINTTVRWSKGVDVNAACGQLRSKSMGKSLRDS
ncbi:putative dual-specificity RNA methyltransferase RlmN [Pontiella desulfatans]|uniref:Probable dual-specificity RNA methyltransferase RlmN n=1 Tax=Pontiella desulfatans TaxID=2750659 RepID=A0A6C2TX95_PONDE|nr:23S rRNA (adenine(2503)-C(2))-methyltransferase RlmN [Pontiella desulfatans]VGO11931.1 putative dual-specificity RNA methyltransferase RlmN [Pontiella desulfatans]